MSTMPAASPPLSAWPFSASAPSRSPRLSAIDWVPKTRYAVMGAVHAARSADLGQRMMKQTAGIQVNLDGSDESDCFARLRLAQALAPLLYALFANSPLLDGKPSGFLSTRGPIWADAPTPTAPACSPFLLDPEAGYAAYVEHALDVPMYFIRRAGHYLDMTAERVSLPPLPGRGLCWPLCHACRLGPASFDPLHRSPPAAADRGAFHGQPAAGLEPGPGRPAQGVALRPRSQPRRLEVVPSRFHRPPRHDDAARLAQGLHAPWRGGTLRICARESLVLARAGLRRQRLCASCDEGVFLDDIEEIVASGTDPRRAPAGRMARFPGGPACPAGEALRLFGRSWPAAVRNAVPAPPSATAGIVCIDGTRGRGTGSGEPVFPEPRSQF